MGKWLKANGGPLAFVVVGLGLAGFTTPLAWIIVGVGVLWFLGEQTRVLDRIPWRLHRKGGISARFEYDGRYLAIGIVNEGATMRDAGINVLVPERCKRIMRMTSAMKVAGGDYLDTSESLEADGVPSIYWSEKKLHLLGGGNSTLFYFLVGGTPGEYPVRLKLYDDADGPRRALVDGEFTIPARSSGEHPAPAANEPPTRPEITVSLRYKIDGSLVVSVFNSGPTIEDATLELLAPGRPERQYLYRQEESLSIVTTGQAERLQQELLDGYPTAWRWGERNLQIAGGSRTEWRFFLPRYEGDPIHVRIGADALGGWKSWVFITPHDDELVMREAAEGTHVVMPDSHEK